LDQASLSSPAALQAHEQACGFVITESIPALLAIAIRLSNINYCQLIGQNSPQLWVQQVQQLVLLRYLLLQVGPCLFVPPLEKDGEKYVLLVRRKICTCGPAKKICGFGPAKICGLGPTKNIYCWSGEKYVVWVRRKICTFGPAKNMYFWSGEK
jgi:hypothetical protein